MDSVSDLGDGFVTFADVLDVLALFLAASVRKVKKCGSERKSGISSEDLYANIFATTE